MAARPQPRGHHAEEQEREGEAEGEGVLAGECRQNVPAVDGEARLEEEREGRRREARGPRIAEAGEPPEGPGAHRQQQRAEHRDQLERDVVGDHRVEQHGEDARQGEVEGVEREAVVPARVPPRQLSVGEEVRLQERGQCHVRTGVAARGGRRGEQQVGMELAEGDGGHPDDRHQVGPSRQRGAPGQPPKPRGRPAEVLRPLVGRRRPGGRDVDRGRHLRARPFRTRPGHDRGRSSQKGIRAPRAAGATTAATAIRLKVACATMFMPRRPVR